MRQRMTSRAERRRAWNERWEQALDDEQRLAMWRLRPYEPGAVESVLAQQSRFLGPLYPGQPTWFAAMRPSDGAFAPSLSNSGTITGTPSTLPGGH
jgi:hypothetical protein